MVINECVSVRGKKRHHLQISGKAFRGMILEDSNFYSSAPRGIYVAMHNY